MQEIWKPIPEFHGAYEASSLGRIRSIDRTTNHGRKVLGKVLRPYVNDSGRHVVYPCADGKSKAFLVHRLVLMAHVGPCPDGMECRHLDDVATNNVLNNLQWGTKSENVADKVRNGKTNRGERASYAKLNDAAVRAIRADKRALHIIAAEYGITKGAVWSVTSGNTWSHVSGEIGSRTRRGENASNAKLTAADVLAIRADTRFLRILANEYGVSLGQIYLIKKRKSWAHL